MSLKILLACLFVTNVYGLTNVEVINQWSFASFDFPDYDSASRYKPENTVFTGLEITEDRLFLAFPRLYSGIPVTLGMIPRHTTPGSTPTIQAYPNWSFHGIDKSNDTCDTLISVYRIRQDSCNRLWVLDSGINNSIEDFVRVCPPKILIFDLRTDQIVRSIIFPKEVLRPASLFTNLIIDESVQGSCDSAMVYISDTAAPGIIVYDSLKDQAWRLLHPSMFPDPNFGDYEINGETFTLMDGIVGLAHSPSLGLLYFQPLATDRVFSIPTSELRKGPLGINDALPIQLAGKKSSQGLGLAMDTEDNTLFFSPLKETSLASWNPLTNKQEILAMDAQRLQFLSEIRYAEKDNGNIWCLSTRFQKYFKKTVSGDEINLRILRLNRHKNSFGLSNFLYFK